MSDEDYEGEEEAEEYYPVYVREIEARPFTKFAVLHFASVWAVGFFRTGLEAFSVLGDALLGAEGYKRIQRDFEDEVRAQLDSIPTTEE